MVINDLPSGMILQVQSRIYLEPTKGQHVKRQQICSYSNAKTVI